MRAIEFCEPPPLRTSHRADGNLADIAAALKAAPDRWALIGKHPSSGRAAGTATSYRRGIIVAFRPAGSFEAVSRKIADGEYGVWVRFVGDSAASSSVVDEAGQR